MSIKSNINNSTQLSPHSNERLALIELLQCIQAKKTNAKVIALLKNFQAPHYLKKINQNLIAKTSVFSPQSTNVLLSILEYGNEHTLKFVLKTLYDNELLSALKPYEIIKTFFSKNEKNCANLDLMLDLLLHYIAPINWSEKETKHNHHKNKTFSYLHGVILAAAFDNPDFNIEKGLYDSNYNVALKIVNPNYLTLFKKMIEKGAKPVENKGELLFLSLSMRLTEITEILLTFKEINTEYYQEMLKRIQQLEKTNQIGRTGLYIQNMEYFKNSIIKVGIDIEKKQLDNNIKIMNEAKNENKVKL
jgi:hypothetical protein